MLHVIRNDSLHDGVEKETVFAAARVLTRTKEADHFNLVLRGLHWLPVCQRRDFEILLLVYKALNGFGPK